MRCQLKTTQTLKNKCQTSIANFYIIIAFLLVHEYLVKMKKSDYFLIDEIEKKLVITRSECQEKEQKNISISISKTNSGEFETKSEHDAALETVFQTFYKNIMSAKFNQTQIDLIMNESEALIRNFSKVLCVSQNDTANGNKLSVLNNIMCQKFLNRDAHHKRLKEAEKNPFFVRPLEVTVGPKWKNKINPALEIPDNTMVSDTIHYIPMMDTLKSLFAKKDYRLKYLDYNLNRKHKCSEGEYQDFCCGKIAKMREIFNDSTSLQIEISIDDFEVCSALKTKANLHNVTGIYFRIRNLPMEYNSRLEHHHVIALGKAAALKKHDAFDAVVKRIVKEFHELKTIGIEIENINIKGALINICADNLGANAIFGFVKCFNVDGFCRVCSCKKVESETQIVETSENLWDFDTYLECVQRASEGCTPRECQGVVKYCYFNEINDFNIFENYCTDIMHDILEGVVHVFLKCFFEFLKEKKIVSCEKIISMVRDFNYGFLGKKNKPSKIIFTKKNYNQNAIQGLTLIHNLPFIFYAQKDELSGVWNLLSLLLQIMQIIFSYKITENDLNRLSKLVPEFLSGLIARGIKLTPKLHNMIHYVTVIRNTGPLIHMWAMRTESKHKVFTNIARTTNCFKNITQTLATRYQEMTCFKDELFSDKIVLSKRNKKFECVKEFDIYKYSGAFKENFKFEVCFAFEFLHINAFEYRKGLMLISNNTMLEIKEILKVNNDFFLICSQYESNGFNKDLHSIEIHEIQNKYKLVSLAEEYPKPYEKKHLNNKMFIFADNLSVYNNFTD